MKHRLSMAELEAKKYLLRKEGNSEDEANIWYELAGSHSKLAPLYEKWYAWAWAGNSYFEAGDYDKSLENYQKAREKEMREIKHIEELDRPWPRPDVNLHKRQLAYIDSRIKDIKQCKELEDPNSGINRALILAEERFLKGLEGITKMILIIGLIGGLFFYQLI